MRLRQLKIRNFRGIQELDWCLPDNSVFCLIGPGDSTKSTILEAIAYALHPQWTISVNDSDFYLCKSSEISIEITLGDLPDEFRALTKHGQHLRGWNKTDLILSDEPGDGLEEVLTVEFSVDQSLDPRWLVKNDRLEVQPSFSEGDRAKAGLGHIGHYADRHLTWNKGSVLSRLTSASNINASLAGAVRSAKESLDTRRDMDLTDFDAVASNAELTAKTLGVPVRTGYKADLDVGAINIRRGGLALHDGDIPLRQLGLGSRRILTCALQKQVLKQPHVTLFDEVEMGLDPRRISRLLSHVKEDLTGQYFLTTHSPVVLRELTVRDLYVVHCRDGIVEIIPTEQDGIAGSLQGHMRSGAETFLSSKILVCEGATEVGLCRGLDNYWTSQGKLNFAYQGVSCFDAGGASKLAALARNLNGLKYSVAVLADSDAQDQFSYDEAANLKAAGVEVFCWKGNVSVEERILSDIPWDYVMQSIDCAKLIGHSVIDQIQSKYGPGFDRDPTRWTEGAKMRTAIQQAAKDCEWFKRQSWAEEWLNSIVGALDLPELAKTDLIQELSALRVWIDS